MTILVGCVRKGVFSVNSFAPISLSWLGVCGRECSLSIHLLIYDYLGWGCTEGGVHCQFLCSYMTILVGEYIFVNLHFEFIGDFHVSH